ncbi:Hypothetical protein R9X50_00414000 [Acrodontium crateriforme]|uniref:NmrA-like domain-containing protein n=1 Tax=Acrodontium crateriforme TaxID=150365 RepID=A0AAQ3M7G2_9PEZI|nr:Hypothetical protein R9X50_00414000 [Acrodontium crateriforme]
MQRILVIVGATGNQGGSVIDAVLRDAKLNKDYRLRGITRNLEGASAKALVERGIEMVQAETGDEESHVKAFEGAHTIFASTVTVYDGHAYDHEIAHGRALADAAVKAAVPYYIYSTLPNAGQISNGKLKHMGHFDGKAEVEAYIRKLPLKSAFIAPGCFMSNFHDSLAPRPMGPGTYGIANFVKPETQLPLIDTASDTGKWVTAILCDFEQYHGKVLQCATGLYTMQGIVDAMSKSSGKTILYKQIPRDIWKSFLPPTMKDHLSDMFQYFEEFGYYGEKTKENVDWSSRQARGKLTTLDEYLIANKLQLD